MLTPSSAQESSDLAHIEHLLRETFFWHIADDANFRCVNKREPDVIISAATLAEYHPLLPVALKAAIEHRRGTERIWNSVGGKNVQHTAELLRYGAVVFPDVDGKSCLFFRMDKSLIPESTYDCVGVSGDNLLVHYVEHEGQQVPFVIDSNWRSLMVPQQVLTILYPGWKERFAIGTALDLEDDRLGRYVFSTIQKPGNPIISDEFSFE